MGERPESIFKLYDQHFSNFYIFDMFGKNLTRFFLIGGYNLKKCGIPMGVSRKMYDVDFDFFEGNRDET